MNAAGRKRIVINLEHSRGSDNVSGRRVRWSRVMALLAIGLAGILCMAAISGYLWWRHYQTTPAYSLALIVDAAQRNDLPTINRLIDYRSLVRSTQPGLSSRCGASPLNC